jgi:hypothetical protein
LRVSPSGFFTWRSKPPSATEIRRAWLTDLVVRIWEDSRRSYGKRRIRAELADAYGEVANHKLIRRIMREQGIFGAAATADGGLTALASASMRLFSAEPRRAKLLKAEIAAPGRQVAYIRLVRPSAAGNEHRTTLKRCVRASHLWCTIGIMHQCLDRTRCGVLGSGQRSRLWRSEWSAGEELVDALV